MSAGGTVTQIGHPEFIVRGFTEVRSTPSARPERVAPDFVRPDAFLAWGAESQFNVGDFRKDAEDPITVGVEGPYIPLQGDYMEEGRKWEDFEIVNPENTEQKVVVPRTFEVAFSAPPRRAKDSRPHYEHNYYTAIDQVTLSFQSSGAVKAPTPAYLKASDGTPFEPVVLSPFQWITDVGWPSFEYFFIYLLFDNRNPQCAMEVHNPRGANINTWGGLGKDIYGNPIREGSRIEDATGHPILDENGEEQFYSGPGDLATTPLATLAEGNESVEPGSGGGWREHFEELPEGGTWTGAMDIGMFSMGRLSQRGGTYIIVGPGDPGSTGHPEIGQITPDIQRFMDTFHISGLGSDGAVLDFEGNPYQGGTLHDGDSPPQQMRLQVGTLFTVHGYDVDFTKDPPENIPWTRSSGNGVIPNASFFRGNIYFYTYARPAFTIEHDRTFKWWIGYINASLLWKMFRKTYTGEAKQGNIPEPIEVSIFAAVGEDVSDEHDGPAGLVRARWSWHRGKDELEEISGWDRELREHEDDGGGGIG